MPPRSENQIHPEESPVVHRVIKGINIQIPLSHLLL